MHERSLHEDASFITLTYRDEDYPWNGSLHVPTVQMFMKRLRAKVAPTRIRFFLCGEYGESSGRAHYHAIIFGFSFPDKVLWKEDGDIRLYRSPLLDKVWGRGFCSVGEVSFDSAAYVANYATKKVVGKRAAAHYGGRTPEFLTMSRRPGIGADWIKKFSSDVFPSDEVIVDGFPTRPPRFYDLALEKRDPKLWEEIRTKRSAAAELLEELVTHKSGKTYMVRPCANARRLLVRETVAKAKASLKSRTLEG